jgi:hypothetical protein
MPEIIIWREAKGSLVVQKRQPALGRVDEVPHPKALRMNQGLEEIGMRQNLEN